MLNRKMISKGVILAPALFLYGVTLAQAQGGGPPPGGGGGGGITNPLGNNTTLFDILVRTAQFLLGFVAVLALLAFIAGGFSMILAFGDEDKVKRGKNIIFWAIAGLVVVMLSYFIITTVSLLLGAF